jgi:hypothetical protein
MEDREPILGAMVINPHLYQKFMNEGKEFQNLLALYIFYTYHAQLQKTNQVFATNKFVKKGLGWGEEKIKRIKAILKKLGVIQMVRKRYSTYIKLVYIYTKKRISKLLENTEAKEPKVEVESPLEVEVEIDLNNIEMKSPMQEELEESGIESKRAENIKDVIYDILTADYNKVYRIDNSALVKWIVYCEKSNIKFTKNSIKQWIEKLNGELTIEQFQAVDRAIHKKWKNFYPISSQTSDYQRFLGRSIKLKEVIHRGLKDIYIENGRAIYGFEDGKQIRAKSDRYEEIVRLFELYEYL